MEILPLSGYTEKEKLNIAQGYLVPRQIKENGLRMARRHSATIACSNPCASICN